MSLIIFAHFCKYWIYFVPKFAHIVVPRNLFRQTSLSPSVRASFVFFFYPFFCLLFSPLLLLSRSALFLEIDGRLSRCSFYGRICNFKLTGSHAAALCRGAIRCNDERHPSARLAHSEIFFLFFIARFTMPVTQTKENDEGIPRSPLRRSSLQLREM